MGIDARTSHQSLHGQRQPVAAARLSHPQTAHPRGAAIAACRHASDAFPGVAATGDAFVAGGNEDRGKGGDDV